ncbi:hypothetical protein EMPS_11631 [Entomortierella parvispora]|uniref:Uncharacterized protein n=1 Tax=Entomortierella parvispora TaxID=205924 RepID=A0A9P3M338_9FUNG|nr:hypothetical protein EMPS_11631 [Entomortierella parvispora]
MMSMRTSSLASGDTRILFPRWRSASQSPLNKVGSALELKDPTADIWKFFEAQNQHLRPATSLTSYSNTVPQLHAEQPFPEMYRAHSPPSRPLHASAGHRCWVEGYPRGYRPLPHDQQYQRQGCGSLATRITGPVLQEASALPRKGREYQSDDVGSGAG